VPAQEPGHVPARPLPYQPTANATQRTGAVVLALGNTGTAAVQLQVYDRITAAPAQRIDVSTHGSVSATVPVVAAYDIAVHGPNGFLREAAGAVTQPRVDVAVVVIGAPREPRLRIRFTNSTSRPVAVVATGITGRAERFTLAPGTRSLDADPVEHAHGWYDLSVRLDGYGGYLRRFAGHLENGQNSITG
jgi:phospholipase C